MESVGMQPHEENFMKLYYTDEAWAKRIPIITHTSPQTLEAYRQKWKRLFLEVEAGLDLDPGSEAAQLLARRWVLLAEAMSEGDSGIKAGAIDAWKDHRNWPCLSASSTYWAFVGCWFWSSFPAVPVVRPCCAEL